MTFTDDELKIIQEQVGAVQSSADVHWVVYCGVLVFLMQAGFAMLCAGYGPASHVGARAGGRGGGGGSRPGRPGAPLSVAGLAAARMAENCSKKSRAPTGPSGPRMPRTSS